MFYRRIFGFPHTGFRTPFSQLASMRSQMDRLLDALDANAFRTPSAGVFPLINLTEDREKYYVRAELPGVKAGDLDIQIDTKNLSISGKREIESADTGVKYHRKERDEGKFSRMIGLPGEIDSEKIEAKLSQGVLKVVITKAEAVKPKQITVN